MGEHKLREAGNGDEPVKVSTHISRVVDLLMPMAPEQQQDEIEQGFQEVAERAQVEDSLIMTVTHTVHFYQLIDEKTNRFEVWKSITIVAQRVSRSEWEKQQRMMQMGRR